MQFIFDGAQTHSPSNTHANDAHSINTCITLVGDLQDEAVMSLKITLEDEAARTQMLRLTCLIMSEFYAHANSLVCAHISLQTSSH